jgi:gluconolactonase
MKTTRYLPQGLSMPNGATNWCHEGEAAVLWCEQGKHDVDDCGMKETHAALVAYADDKEHDHVSSRVVLDNYKGRPFTSLNDVVVHAQSGVVFFTDPDYGIGQGFKRASGEVEYAPNGLYAWHPPTGTVKLLDERYVKGEWELSWMYMQRSTV